MRILIDECFDWRLGRALTGHDCVSVQKMGWGGIKNGRLLALAQAEFDVFLTADRNLSFQQNTTKSMQGQFLTASPSFDLLRGNQPCHILQEQNINLEN